MTSAEHPSKEIVPTGLDDELRERYNTLLQNAADHLEFTAQPDELLYEIQNIAFGMTGEEHITTSHTTDRGFHYGKISYVHGSDGDVHNQAKRSFILTNELDDGSIWQTGKGFFNTGHHALKMIARNWPISSNSEAIKSLIENSAPQDDDHPPEEVPVENVFDVLERYALDNQTGDMRYERTWQYTEATVDTVTKDTIPTSLTFVIIRDDEGAFRQIRVELSVAYLLNGLATPLVYHIHSDEVGNVLVNATAKDAETDKLHQMPIQNYEACYAEVELFVERLLAEKTGQ